MLLRRVSLMAPNSDGPRHVVLPKFRAAIQECDLLPEPKKVGVREISEPAADGHLVLLGQGRFDVVTSALMWMLIAHYDLYAPKCGL